MPTLIQKAKQEIAQAVKDAGSLMAKQTADAGSLMAKQAADAIKVISDAAALAKQSAEKKECDDKDSHRGSNILYKQVSLATGVLGLAGMLIMGYLFLANPSQDNDKALALQQQRVEAQEKTIVALTKTQQNDTQEVKQALENTNTQIQLQSNEIIKLSTIIEERIPKKQ